MWLIYLLMYIIVCIFICRFMGMTKDIKRKDVNSTKPKTR